MGIIQPPWVTKKWFLENPFNYCDHFGDKEELALMCVICREDEERIERYKKEGKDPYAIENVFKEVVHDLELSMALLENESEKLGVSLKDLADTYEEETNTEHNRVYELVDMYGEKVGKLIRDLETEPSTLDNKIIIRAIDVFAHSRTYMVVKLARALSSRKKEKESPIIRELADSKTSALFSYMAINRNARALFRLSKLKLFVKYKKRFQKLSQVSFTLCELVRKEFFPNDLMKYEEFGCDSYNKLFP